MNDSIRTLSRRLGLVTGALCLLAVPAITLADVAKPDDGAKAPPERSRQATPPTGREGAPPPRRGRDAGPSDDLLRGPRVRPGDAGPGRPFGPQNDRQRAGAAGPQIPPRLWMATLRDLELSEELRAEVRTMMQEFEKERMAYMEEHGPKLRELEREARLAREAAGDDNAEVVATLREAIAKVREQAPKVEKVQEAIFAKLSEEQKAEMRARLKEIQDRQREMRERRMREGAGPDGPARESMEGDRPMREGAEAPPQRPQRGQGEGRPARQGRPGGAEGTESGDRPRRQRGGSDQSTD